MALIDEMQPQTGRKVKEDSTVINTADLLVNNMVSSAVKRATPANIAASQTDSVLVAGVATKKLRVISVVMVAGATATTCVFNSKPAGASAPISCVFANGANSGAVLGRNTDGWFETVAGEALTVTTGAGSATGIMVNYQEV